MENNYAFNPTYGNSPDFISLDELSNIQNGSQQQKNANVKRRHFKFQGEENIKFPNTAEEVAMFSTDELADLVVDKVADVFGRDVKGIADEVMISGGLQIPCFKLVFTLSKNPGEDCIHAVEPVNQSNDSIVQQLSLVSNALNKGVVEKKEIVLTNDAYDFLLDKLYNDNECFNDMSNSKFEKKYVKYEHSLADNRVPQIHVHGISLEKACEFVFGPADYRVEIGGMSKEYGRLIRVVRLTKEKVRAAQKKYVGVRVNDENLRTPNFGV